MKAILTAMTAAACIAAATGASPGAGLVDGFVTAAVAGKPSPDSRPATPAAPDRGYIAYSGDASAPPGPGCYWTRMPIYDVNRNVIGWRGRPVAVCP